jgi:hypothetical protein
MRLSSHPLTIRSQGVLGLGNDWRQLGLMCAPLPLMAYDALTRATAAACARVGLEGLSVLSFRSTHYDTQGPTEVERHESFLAPYGVSASGATWLNLSVVDPMVTLACGTALELAAAALVSRTTSRIGPLP